MRNNSLLIKKLSRLIQDNNIYSYIILRGLLFLLISIIILPNAIVMVSASAVISDSFNITQPDGTSFIARQISDVDFSCYITEDGYSISKGNDGYWYYIDRDTGNLSYIVNNNPKSTSHRGIYISPSEAKRIYDKNNVKIQNITYLTGSSIGDLCYLNPNGTIKFAVILIKFTDSLYAPNIYDYNDLIFTENPSQDIAPYGSVHDYWKAVSNNKTTIIGDVFGWYTADHNLSYYNTTGTPTDLVIEAISKADNDIYYQNYDAVIVVFCRDARYTPPFTPNPTQQQLTVSTNDGVNVNHICCVNGLNFGNQSIATIGTYSHEIGHQFGLFDLYGFGEGGVGVWDLMGFGTWADPINKSIFGNGSCPAELSPWEKATLHLMTPTQITSSSTVDIPVIENNDTTYQILDNPDGYDYLINDARSIGEFFLLEYRRNDTGFGRGMPGQGLLIWHIDEHAFKNHFGQRPYVIELVEANDQDDSDTYTVPWYAPYKTIFNAFSSPNSNLNNGSPSGVSVTGISEVPLNPDDPMHATIGPPLQGYASVKTHNIPGSVDGVLSDYQVQFLVHNTSGTDSARDIYLDDGGSLSWPFDFRFTNTDNQPLSYWIESYNSTVSTVWVKVDSIAEDPATTPVNVYYGKAGDLGESNGSATFVFFDDFTGTSLNSTGWRNRPSCAAVSNGVLNVSGNNGGNVLSSGFYGVGYALESRMSITSTWETDNFIGFCNSTPTCSPYAGVFNTWSSSTWKYDPNYVGGDTGVSLSTVWTRFTSARCGNGTSIGEIDNGGRYVGKVDSAPYSVCVHHYGNGVTRVDWVAVRKYTTDEPVQFMNMNTNLYVVDTQTTTTYPINDTMESNKTMPASETIDNMGM